MLKSFYKIKYNNLKLFYNQKKVYNSHIIKKKRIAFYVQWSEDYKDYKFIEKKLI